MAQDDGSHTGSQTVADAAKKLEDSHTVGKVPPLKDSANKPETGKQEAGKAPAQSGQKR